MGIVAEDIARVREATDFVAVASEHIALKRVGRQWVGLCPFHAEKSPSFGISAEQGLYYCFGCGAGGDAIRFVQELEHLEFADAVERLAAKVGIQLRYDTAAVSQDRRRRTRLVEVMARAVDWYHDRLLSGSDAAAARSYLRSRGYDGEVVRNYRIGWAPEGWDTLARALDVPDDVLRDTGLGRLNSIGRQQDEFRGRVLFPIFDVRGDPVGFGGRALPGGRPPKYRNSPETPLYAKSRLLYGLNWAKAQVVTSGEVIVCEGYTDVIGMRQAGLDRAVATCGTSLTEDHVRALKNFARRIVLAFDADAAGQAAAARFYEWESSFEVDIAVADLPPGSDPGDLGSSDPDRLRAGVEGARPFLGFRIDRALASADLRSAEGRARAAQVAVDAIREHPNELVRDQYLMEVADLVKIEADRLRPILARPAAPRRAASPAERSGPAGEPARRVARKPPSAGPELEALRVAVHHPGAVAESLHESLFADPIILAAYEELCRADTLHDAVAAADDEVAALLQRIAVEPVDLELADDVMALLAKAAAKRAVLALTAESRGAQDPLRYNDDIAWLKLTLEELGDPSTAVEATGRLVRWLIGRAEPS